MQQQNNSLAIVSLVMGVMGLLGLLPLIGSILAIILGHIARRQIASDHTQSGEGLALVGLITGYVGLVLACAGFMVAMLFFGGSLMAMIVAIFAGATTHAELLMLL